VNCVGHYELRGLLGKGGMGEVYRALDTKLGREVALKVLPEAFAHDADRMARFEREAQVLASLNHPSIAAIYGLEDSDSIRALVMELVEGPTLAEQIGGRAMPLEEALPIAKQIAEALEYAHEKGIIHRDLKPTNVKLTADGNVKVLDFGLAKALEGPARGAGDLSVSPTLTMEGTRAGVILGTAAYMAPEQARGAVVDKRADIWSFGVVLYEMLTGEQPFEGVTVSDTLAAVLKTEPDLRQVPAQTQNLLRRCLEKDPKRRLRDVGDAMPLLEGASETFSAPRSNLWWKIAAGALAVALIVALVLRWPRPVTQPITRLSVELPEFAVTPIETTPGAGIALSPDGRRLIYTGRGSDGKLRLYTRTLDQDQDQAAPLAGTEGVYGPFFSPDGQTVGFFAGGKLKTIPVRGGPAVALCDVAFGVGGSWGDDGNIIAALHNLSFLSRIPSSGGPAQAVTKLRQESKELAHIWPQVLPGAHTVLFTALTSEGASDQATIEVLSLQTGERKALVHGGYYGRYVPSGHLLYVHQGTLYAAPMDVKRLELTGPAAPVVEEVVSSTTYGFAQMDFSQSGTLIYIRGKPAKQMLVWLDSTGQQTLRANAAEYSGTVHFSPDGKRLAMGVVEGGNANVWMYEWGLDTITRLTFTPFYDAYPMWSPDGKHIVFSSMRHGGPNLYWMRADGAGEAERLTESPNPQIAFSFSPDGSRVAFMERRLQTGYDLWTLPLADMKSDHPKPGKPEPFLVTPFDERTPTISPDGRWLAYMSDESGRYEVYVRPFPVSGGKWQISTGYGTTPVWSRNRKELFYRSGEGMMVASYTTNGEAFVVSKPRLWAGKKNMGDYFDLAPDGKRFALLQPEASEQKGPQHVTFLLNFFDELRRRVPAGK
jgi:Tol biopolymer transport system component